MGKTLQQIFTEKKITTQTAALKLCKGKKFKIVAPPQGYGASGHNYGAVGTMFTANVASASNFAGLGGSSGSCALKGPGFNGIYYYEVELMGGTLEDLQNEQKDNLKEIEKLKAENAILDEKMEYMKVNELTEYDEDLFRVFYILKVLDKKNVTGMDRAKAVQDIIKLS